MADDASTLAALMARPGPKRVVYEEWEGSDLVDHLRVSVLDDGRYAVEVDVGHYGPGASAVAYRDGFFHGAGALGKPLYEAFVEAVEQREVLTSCDYPNECLFFAEVTFLSLGDGIAGYRASWTSRDCEGFPSGIAEAASEVSTRAHRRAGLIP